MKAKVLKFIYIMSFIPYAYLIYLILFGKFNVDGDELQRTERILGNIVFILKYNIFMPIIPTCLTFQMCYIFRKKGKIMLMCSFIPCIFVLLLGLKGSFFGASFMGDKLYYGTEGFGLGIFSGFIYYVIWFPLLPICLIFQIGYIIIKLKNKK